MQCSFNWSFLLNFFFKCNNLCLVWYLLFGRFTHGSWQGNLIVNILQLCTFFQNLHEFLIFLRHASFLFSFSETSFYKFQVVQPCKHIPNILFQTSFGLEIMLSHIFGVRLFHSYVVAVYSLPTSGTIHRGNNAPSQPQYDCIRSIILTGNNMNGFQCLQNICSYQQSNRYVDIFIDLAQDSFNIVLTLMVLLHVPYLLVSISYIYICIYICNISQSSYQSSELFRLLSTFSPLITDNLLVDSPLNISIIIDVLLPFMSKLFSSLSKTK